MFCNVFVLLSISGFSADNPSAAADKNVYSLVLHIPAHTMR